jgi:hypothetical protein
MSDVYQGEVQMAVSRSGLRGASFGDIQKEIQRRQHELQSLVRRRAKLAGELEALNMAIAEQGLELGGMATAGMTSVMRGAAPMAGGRKRPRNDQNLADALAEVLSKQTLSVTEVSEEVQRHGYRTTSPNFRTIVNQTLIKDPRFTRVGRGLYTSKPGGGGGAARGRGRGRKRRGAAAAA